FQALWFVQRIDLGGHNNLFALTKLRIVSLHFAIDNLVIAHGITPGNRRNIDEMQQQARPFDMPQKAFAQSMPLMSAFEQSGNVRDHKRTKITEIDDAEMRLERGKRIVGNLWFRGRNRRNKSRFARVRKPD